MHIFAQIFRTCLRRACLEVYDWSTSSPPMTMLSVMFSAPSKKSTGGGLRNSRATSGDGPVAAPPCSRGKKQEGEGDNAS